MMAATSFAYFQAAYLEGGEQCQVEHHQHFNHHQDAEHLYIQPDVKTSQLTITPTLRSAQTLYPYSSFSAALGGSSYRCSGRSHVVWVCVDVVAATCTKRKKKENVFRISKDVWMEWVAAESPLPENSSLLKMVGGKKQRQFNSSKGRVEVMRRSRDWREPPSLKPVKENNGRMFPRSCMHVGINLNKEKPKQWKGHAGLHSWTSPPHDAH